MNIKTIIDESQKIVFFGGAGVSTESGIPDFRSKDGLYNQKYTYPPEKILSHSFFINNTKEFFKFYKDKMNLINYEPNIVHKKLVELENNNKLIGIITQNIDNLHQKAGSKNVVELHGNINRNYCTKCKKFYDGKFIFNSKDIPKCSCGEIIKPDVVLYEEQLKIENIKKAINLIETADTLIVAGTSLTVYPACNLITYFKGKHLILINKDKTPFDNYADLVIHDNLKNIFKNI